MESAEIFKLIMELIKYAIIISFVFLTVVTIRKQGTEKKTSTGFMFFSIFSIIAFLLTIWLVYIPMIFHTTDPAGPGFAFIGLAPIQLILSALAFITYRRVEIKSKLFIILGVISVLPVIPIVILLGRVILVTMFN
jgi:hypothetical protein